MSRDVPRRGLSERVVDQDYTLVSRAEWVRLAGIKAIIGRCQGLGCGGDMQAIDPDEHDRSGEPGEVTWYESRCARCGREVAAPNGRVLARSGLTSEQPRGFQQAREERDQQEVKGRAGYDDQGHPQGRRKVQKRWAPHDGR